MRGEYLGSIKPDELSADEHDIDLGPKILVDLLILWLTELRGPSLSLEL